MAHSVSRPSQALGFLSRGGRKNNDQFNRYSESCENDESGYGSYGDQPQMMRPADQCSPMAHNSSSYLGAGNRYLGGGLQAPILPQGRTVRLSCKGNTDFTLGVRNGRRVAMVYYDPNDLTQQWVKDESWSSSVRDSVGHSAFCLVNKATGKALRHAPGAYQQVLLTNYEPGSYDESVMWSQSEDMGEGYKTVRMAHNIQLNLDVFQGDIQHGGVKDGNACVLWTWNRQDNQLWKINPVF